MSGISAPNAKPIRTSKVRGRRVLRFERLDDILDEATRLTRHGEPRRLGNWSAGQIMLHLARSCQSSIDGAEIKIAWWMRLVGRALRRRLLQGPLPAGFQLPRPFVARLIPGQTSTADGYQVLREAIERLKATSNRVPHPALGELTRDEWDQIHLRHAELHFSFLIPAEGP